MEQDTGKTIKIIGSALGFAAFFVGIFIFLMLTDSPNEDAVPWVGLLVSLGGILVGLFFAGFGQLVSNSNTNKNNPK